MSKGPTRQHHQLATTGKCKGSPTPKGTGTSSKPMCKGGKTKA